MPEIVKVRETTSGVKGGVQTTSSNHGDVSQTKSSGSRTDTQGSRTDLAPLHRGVTMTVRLAIYQPRLGDDGGTLDCP